MIPVKRRRILLIEDDTDSARALADCLPCFDVDGAHTFRDARWKLMNQEVPYSAIILDLRLPDAQGATLAQNIHQIWPHIPIIVVTGMPPEEAPTVVVRRAGAEKVLRKPVDPDELREALINTIAPRESKQGALGEARKEVKDFMTESSMNLKSKTDRTIQR